MRLKAASQLFRLNVPISGGFYAVCNPDAAKEILKDKTSDKPPVVYKPFDSVFGGPNIFTRSSHDKLWASVRKSTNHAFPHAQVSRMNRICTEHADMWIIDRLQSNINESGSFVFDPSIEMTHLAFRLIMESAFEYTSTEEDFETYSHHVNVSMQEFAFKEAMNPFRVLYRRFDPSYYRALRSSKKIQEFGRKVLNTFRNGNDPKRSDAKTLIKIISINKNLTENQMVTEMLSFMNAGFDATGYSLATALV